MRPCAHVTCPLRPSDPPLPQCKHGPEVVAAREPAPHELEDLTLTFRPQRGGDVRASPPCLTCLTEPASRVSRTCLTKPTCLTPQTITNLPHLCV